MKIRLMGSKDLVRAWSAAFGVAFGITGQEYPSRYSENECRIYFDIDDRTAADIVLRSTKEWAGGKPKRKQLKKAEGS